MASEMSYFNLIMEASIVVQLVMLLLCGASLICWMFIIQKYKMLEAAEQEAENFEDRFWSGVNLRDLYTEKQAKADRLNGMERIFTAGFHEFTRLSKSNHANPDRIVDGVHRAMRVSLSREVDRLETHLNFLATVGSTSPYVGLFGTVWGIMNSFRALGNVQQATLSMVAPGISEALIATAMGLFAAIPAVIAYNRFSSRVERLVNRGQNFMEEFSTLIQRQVYSKESA